MKDEERLCQCGQKHKWGITGRSEDGVPLYGARPVPDCEYFRPATDQLPQFVGDLRELWSQTGDLDAQATVATRMVIARLRSLEPVAQWPEFVGYVISQLTNMRGALLRDDAKSARMVALADELVETLPQLNERLKKHEVLLGQIAERLEDMEYNRLEGMEMEKDRAEEEALRHFGLVEPDESGFVHGRWTPSLPNEAVLVEKVRDDDDQQQDEGDDDSDPDDEDPEEE